MPQYAALWIHDRSMKRGYSIERACRVGHRDFKKLCFDGSRAGLAHAKVRSCMMYHFLHQSSVIARPCLTASNALNKIDRILD